ncbi:hypothetical protein HG530_004103 [Fusarium avenaceum]|nr:hypothetical protein HG530_004103 [Fusarium avenaceum]
MTVLKHFEYVAVEFCVTVEIFAYERLHRNLIPSSVLDPIFSLMKSQVVFHRKTWALDSLVRARGCGRVDGPEGDQNRKSGDEGEEHRGLEPATQTPCRARRDKNQEGNQEPVRKSLVTRTIGGQWRVIYCGRLE